MTLEAQIELMTAPQEFTRLCNAILAAEYGDDFLPIDDDRADGGNDGYRKSNGQVFAIHCFKRIQKQKITDEIRRKMLGDLGKAAVLKQQGLWKVTRWTFLCNYSIPEPVGREAVALGAEAEIEVSWLGPTFLASSLQRESGLRALFPTLQANEIAEELKGLRVALDGPAAKAPGRVPRTWEEQQAVLSARPPGWEYLLFAGYLFLGKEELEFKWRDYELPPFAQQRSLESVVEATDFLSGEFDRIVGLIEAMMLVFPQEVQVQAFGAPGEAGDPVRIHHFATRIMQTYGELLDWPALLRAINPPEILAPAFEQAARMVDQPLLEVRRFVDETVREIDRVPKYLAGHSEGDEPLKIDLELKLAVDEGVSAEFRQRLKRARRKLRWGF